RVSAFSFPAGMKGGCRGDGVQRGQKAQEKQKERQGTQAPVGRRAGGGGPSSGRRQGHIPEDQDASLREGTRPSPDRAGKDAGVDQAREAPRRGDFRRARRGRKRRRYQAHNREPQSAAVPRRGARHADGTGENLLVLSALRAASAGGGRNGAVRPQL